MLAPRLEEQRGPLLIRRRIMPGSRTFCVSRGSPSARLFAAANFSLHFCSLKRRWHFRVGPHRWNLRLKSVAIAPTGCHASELVRATLYVVFRMFFQIPGISPIVAVLDMPRRARPMALALSPLLAVSFRVVVIAGIIVHHQITGCARAPGDVLAPVFTKTRRPVLLLLVSSAPSMHRLPRRTTLMLRTGRNSGLPRLPRL